MSPFLFSKVAREEFCSKGQILLAIICFVGHGLAVVSAIGTVGASILLTGQTLAGRACMQQHRYQIVDMY